IFFALIRGPGALRIGEILLAVGVFLLIPKRKLQYAPPGAQDRRSELLEKRLIRQNYRLSMLSDVLGRVSSLFTDERGPADGYINRQLSGVAESLARMSAPVREPICDVSAPRFRIRFGTASVPKKGSDASGDSCCVRDFDGMYLAVISDGMGSGPAAGRESSQAVQLLADLVTCGFLLSEAAECVNRLLLLRERNEIYATLDAIVFDPTGGRMTAVKHGAPPSYIVRRGTLNTLYAEALPIGIVEEAHPEVCTFRMRHGDVIVMMSDGAADVFSGGEAPAVADIVSGNEPEIAAKLLAELAVRTGGGDDDMTVIVAAVE
ncbi:MAG: SpoIIE family protein phosphatase, partial [Clostridia bacterium]|nr:SpoIIE family protein phosphatase [Clostridia bacterium]